MAWLHLGSEMGWRRFWSPWAEAAALWAHRATLHLFPIPGVVPFRPWELPSARQHWGASLYLYVQMRSEALVKTELILAGTRGGAEPQTTPEKSRSTGLQVFSVGLEPPHPRAHNALMAAEGSVGIESKESPAPSCLPGAELCWSWVRPLLFPIGAVKGEGEGNLPK